MVEAQSTSRKSGFVEDYVIICFYSVFVLYIRDIVVGLFRLAGLEEDEDLLYACTMDVR